MSNERIPLFRTYNQAITDHFYTQSKAERDNAVANLGYKDEGVAGYLHKDAGDNRTPLYRAYNQVLTNHFYTQGKAERDNAVANLGYKDEGVVGYIHEDDDEDDDRTPLYRMFHTGVNDHFYTRSWPERENAVMNLGYKAEGIVGYVHKKRN